MYKAIKYITLGFILGVIATIAFIETQLPKTAEMLDKELKEVTKEEKNVFNNSINIISISINSGN